MTKLRIDAIEARNDGSGQVALDIWALRTVDDGVGNMVDVVIPGKYATALLDANAVGAALALSTNAKKAAELKRLIQLAVVLLQTDVIDADIIANDESTAAASALNDFVPKLPYSFTL